MAWIGENIERLAGTGIVYTGTRSNTEIYSKWLNYLDINSASYHGRFLPEERKEVEEGLLGNRYKCVVSTNALGMGIDKPDIGFIIHTQVPVSTVHYYQEIGRAGRDGKPTMIILFFNPEADKALPLSFIESGKPSAEKYQKVIEAVKEERLGERQLMLKTNLQKTQMRVIKADLVDQGIISEAIDGKSKKYEYRYNAPALDPSGFDTLRAEKPRDFEAMMRYVENKDCRMHFLCEFLGDPSGPACGRCDNDTGKHIRVSVSEAWAARIAAFQADYFPVLAAVERGTNLVEGVAAAYYGFSRVGSTIHRCKYAGGGDFPDYLVKLTVRAFRKHYGQERFDFIACVPPTESGSLVKNFAEKLSGELGIPVVDGLGKTKKTTPQKIFQNAPLKRENVRDAFAFDNPAFLQGKAVLLVDDIYDSGATIKEIGKYMTKEGAEKIAPLVIAKPVGGDL